MSGSTTRNYTIYSATFTLESNQTVGGTRVADGAAGDGMSYTGDTQASLFDGSWRAGDRIVGVGLRYNDASVLRIFYFMVDWAGDSMRAASTVGATDGGYGANTGDISIASPATIDAERFRAKQYSIANGVIGSGGTSVTPYGTNATTASPARGFALLANGSTNAAVGAQFFINLDAIARSNGGAGFGEGLLGPQTKLGLTEAESSFLFTQQTFPVPAPGAGACRSGDACANAGARAAPAMSARTTAKRNPRTACAARGGFSSIQRGGSGRATLVTDQFGIQDGFVSGSAEYFGESVKPTIRRVPLQDPQSPSADP